MSRMYDIRVEISGFRKQKIQDIKDAANKLWDFDWEDFIPNLTCERLGWKPKYDLCGQGQCSLGGGVTNKEFAKNLTKVIFKANGKPCKVLVLTTDLEDLPTDSYKFDENSKLD
jgi:hypothetical protein